MSAEKAPNPLMDDGNY